MFADPTNSDSHTHIISTGKSCDKIINTPGEPTPVTNGNPCLPVDECWLYVPPIQPRDAVVPITQWLREVFESPSSIFSHTRRNLLTRLEAILASGGPIAAYRFGGSVPSLNSHQTRHSSFRQTSPFGMPANVLGVGFRRGTFAIPSVGSSDSLSMITQNGNPDSTSLSFSHVHQPQYSLPPQRSGSQRIATTSSGSASYLSQSLGFPQGTFFSGSAAKVGSCDALETTKANIQEIARIQEDNLKADVAALAAAAAGRHGSQHSLGSHGYGTPRGSFSKLSSAPESPHSSDPHLPQSTLNRSNADMPIMHRSSLDALNIVYPKFDRLDATAPIHHGATTHCTESFNPKRSIDLSVLQSENLTFGFSTRANGSSAYATHSVLSQKRTAPTTVRDQPLAEAPAVVSGPRISYNGIPELLEARTHFGFRPLRKLAPDYSKPPVPATSRLAPTSNTQQYN